MAQHGRNTPHNTNDLKKKLFLHHAWGSDATTLDKFEREAYRAGVGRAEINQLIEQGQQARTLEQELKQQLNRNGAAAGRLWLLQQAGQPTMITKHLQIEHDKWVKFRASKQNNRQVDTSSILTPLQLNGRPHPNNLLHLPPHHEWQIYIDETGENFDESATELSLGDKELGRIVAIAVPVGAAQLPPLDLGFHAIKSTPHQLDRIIDTLRHQPVGILGMTVQDAALQSVRNEWMVAIDTLMRWVLRALPLTASARVEFIIEQRGAYNSGVALEPVVELIRSEYSTLHSDQRTLKLEARFVDKDADPLLGYADAIAHTWGSRAADVKQRLQRSQLRGHCLIDDNSESLLRLLEGINNRHALTPPLWYALMAHLDQFPPHTIVHDALEQLSQLTRSDRNRWQSYIIYCQQQLQTKNYQPQQLQSGLEWLQQAQPEGLELPPLLELEWWSLALATRNHSGDLATQKLIRFRALTEQLREEDSPRCCEAALRIAITATHNYQFDTGLRLIQPWLDTPIAQVGTRNHGKLCSTRGQLAAFMGDAQGADRHFEAALDCFGRLSDPTQSQREQRQTRVYRVINQLDAGLVSNDALQQLIAPPGQPLKAQRIQEIARSGAQPGNHPSDFDHYLLLRALVLTDQLAQFREPYLQVESEWGHGRGHPWPLIQYYRGWLLQQAGQTALSQSYWDDAIQQAVAEQHGPLLRWMGLVMLAGIGRPNLPDESPLIVTLRQMLPALPWDRLQPRNPEEALGPFLNALLPFNFH